VVVVVPPVLAELSSVPQALEAVLVEQLVSRAAVEALGIGVLDGLPRADEVMLDAVLVGPGVERAHRTPSVHGVGQEVHRPAVVHRRRHRPRHPRRLRGALPALATCGGPEPGVDPVDALVVHAGAFSPEHRREPLVAEARSPSRLLHERLLESLDLRLAALVPLDGSVLPCQPASPTLAQAEVGLEVLRQRSASRRADHFFWSADFRASPSRERSATICFKRRFSSPSSRRRFASFTSRPPYLERHA
jgi:hypothetical protein